jgi:hypothetical protein
VKEPVDPDSDFLTVSLSISDANGGDLVAGGQRVLEDCKNF